MSLTLITSRDERTVPTPARLHRLAATANQIGIRVIESIRPDGASEVAAIDPRFPSKRFAVTGFSCECSTFQIMGFCIHHSALLAARGWLPPKPAPRSATIISFPVKATTLA